MPKRRTDLPIRRPLLLTILAIACGVNVQLMAALPGDRLPVRLGTALGPAAPTRSPLIGPPEQP
jgi:hypothetical protein